MWLGKCRSPVFRGPKIAKGSVGFERHEISHGRATDEQNYERQRLETDHFNLRDHILRVEGDLVRWPGLIVVLSHGGVGRRRRPAPEIPGSVGTARSWGWVRTGCRCRSLELGKIKGRPLPHPTENFAISGALKSVDPPFWNNIKFVNWQIFWLLTLRDVRSGRKRQKIKRVSFSRRSISLW